MKRRLGIIIVALVAFCSFFTLPTLFQASPTYAAVDCSSLPEPAAEAAGCYGNENLTSTIVENVLYSVIGLSGLISIVFVVIGGIKFIYSRGSAETVQEGKKAVLYALIGLAVTALAFTIVTFAKGVINNSEEAEGDDASVEEVSVAVGSDEDFYSSDSELGAGADSNAEVTRVSMISQKALKVGSTEKLIARITPSWLAKSEPITWVSDAPNIVSVDSTGKITAKQEGVARITASTENGKSASTRITVTKLIEPDSVTLEPTSINKLIVGRQYNLVATVYPRNATNKHITWSTDNAIVATVNSRGQVTGKKAGTANITAKTENGKTTSIPVKVVEEDGETIKITPILLAELDYFYQTNHHEPISGNCGGTAGSVSCGPASYMAAVYALTKQKVDYVSFINEACNRWLGARGSSIDSLTNLYKVEYRNKYHVDVNRIPNTWDATVKELKKGHAVIFLVHSPPAAVESAQGYKLTGAMHYVVALSYRNQGGGQVYIWSPVSEKAAPGRNIGDCTAGQCWYDKAAFERNINEQAWSVKKVSN